MEIKTIEKLAKNIKDALNVKAFKTFDLYEQFLISDLMKRGHSFENAVKVTVNSVEGDETQLSKGIKKYMKQRKELKK
jgi:hypothetical protein